MGKAEEKGEEQMRLIDADALLEHQVESDKIRGVMLVVGKGHILDAPTIQPDYPPPDDRVTIKLAEGTAAIVRKIDGQYIVDLVRLQPDIPPDEAERYNA